jgi:hypothetical protein
MNNIRKINNDLYYYKKWDFSDIFKNYIGDDGYVIFKPWTGGFNNIRMSLELAVCIAYLSNKTLVLPPKYQMYLLRDEFGLEDFFDISDLKVKNISLKTFCSIKNIELDFNAVKEVAIEITEKEDRIFRLDNSEMSESFRKNREVINLTNTIKNNECVYFNANLLGNFYIKLFSENNIHFNKLIAKHVHYLPKLFDIASKPINWLGDIQYYAIHIRRNDFQYKHLFITAEEIFQNIKEIIPHGARLYVATDHTDMQFFDPLRKNYKLYFYKDIVSQLDTDIHYNYVPIIEQLICSRSIKFIGNDLSTLSSYIYRIRGYMEDILDKNYYINTRPYQQVDQLYFKENSNFGGNWTREYKDSWNFNK